MVRRRHSCAFDEVIWYSTQARYIVKAGQDWVRNMAWFKTLISWSNFFASDLFCYTVSTNLFWRFTFTWMDGFSLTHWGPHAERFVGRPHTLTARNTSGLLPDMLAIKWSPGRTTIQFVDLIICLAFQPEPGIYLNLGAEEWLSHFPG